MRARIFPRGSRTSYNWIGGRATSAARVYLAIRADFDEWLYDDPCHDARRCENKTEMVWHVVDAVAQSIMAVSVRCWRQNTVRREDVRGAQGRAYERT